MGEEIRDVHWFVKNRGLAIGGMDITTLTNEDISVAEIEAVFGPMYSKSGYRYDRKPQPKVVSSIEELYRRVTGKSKVMNSTINQCFARGVVAWLKGQALDWAKYVVHSHRYATDLKTTKALNRERKEQGTVGHEESKSGQQLAIGKCGTHGTRRPSRVKLESGDSSMPVIPLKISCSGGPTRISLPEIPDWKEEEISRVGDLSTTLKTFLLVARKNVLESQEQYTTDVATSQVSKMQLEGREKVYLDSESHRLELVRELNHLVTKHGLQGELPGLARDGEICENDCFQTLLNIDSSSIVSAPSKIREVQQKLEWATKSDEIALSMLNISRKECETASSKVIVSLATLAAKKQKVQDIMAQILLVDQQFTQMKEGGGSCFYPQPVVSCLDYNSEVSYVSGCNPLIEVNDCPVCGHGFKLNDILVASCGHTYHMICMFSHAKQALRCKVPSCGKDFHKDWLVSVGVRPLLQNGDAAKEGERKRMDKLTGACPTMQEEVLAQDQQIIALQNDHFNMLADDIEAHGWDSCVNEQPDLSYSFMTHAGQHEPIISSLESKQGSSIPDISPLLEVTSPLKIRQSAEFRSEVPTFVRPPTRAPTSQALNLNIAFDTLIVPQIEQTESRRVKKQNTKPSLQMEISGAQNETVLEDKSGDSDSEPLFQSGLVHYPPRPILGRDMKHEHISFLSSDDSDTEGEDNSLLRAREVTIDKNISKNGIVVKLEKIEQESKGSLLKENEDIQHESFVTKKKSGTIGGKRKRNPLSPNPTCEKRITRGEAADMEVPKVTKTRRPKKKSRAPKNFNSFS